MPQLAKIFVYPIKSLDSVELDQATLLPGGSLACDREFSLVDQQGKVVNAKRTPDIQRIRSTVDLAARTITVWLQDRDDQTTFHLDGDRPALEAWFGQVFGYAVQLKQDLHMGFPDDIYASGPTLVSTATLEAVAEWFALPVDAVRRRFRANLEISQVPAFWEDQLFAAPGQARPFSIGAIAFNGSHPCQRCIVPTRDPFTGEPYAGFQKQFSERRRAHLPTWAPAEQFNHFYKLTVNTNVAAAEAGKALRLGDALQLG